VGALGAGWDPTDVVLPRRAGARIDALAQRSLGARAGRAVQLLESERARAQGDERACIDASLEAIAGLSPTGRVSTFSSPLAAFDLASDRASPDRRTQKQRALALARHLIGNSALDGWVAVLPSAAFTSGALVAPHVGAAIDNHGGPLAVQVRRGLTLLTWNGGQRATLPHRVLPLHGVALDGLRSLATVDDAMILNGAAEVDAAFATWDLASGAQLARAAAAVADALTLLRTVWPEAADMAERYLRGVLLLEEREGTRSHSPAELAGVVITSATTPQSSADILCHELAHVRMNVLLEFDPLLEDDGVARHVSPWRRDLRPLSGILLGVHAFVDVCSYYKRLIDQRMHVELATVILERQRANVREGMQLLQRAAHPTTAGARVLAALETEVARL
jgi:hypothetical protein